MTDSTPSATAGPRLSRWPDLTLMGALAVLFGLLAVLVLPHRLTWGWGIGATVLCVFTIGAVIEHRFETLRRRAASAGQPVHLGRLIGRLVIYWIPALAIAVFLAVARSLAQPDAVYYLIAALTLVSALIWLAVRWRWHLDAIEAPWSTVTISDPEPDPESDTADSGTPPGGMDAVNATDPAESEHTPWSTTP